MDLSSRYASSKRHASQTPCSRVFSSPAAEKRLMITYMFIQNLKKEVPLHVLTLTGAENRRRSTPGSQQLAGKPGRAFRMAAAVTACHLER